MNVGSGWFGVAGDQVRIFNNKAYVLNGAGLCSTNVGQSDVSVEVDWTYYADSVMSGLALYVIDEGSHVYLYNDSINWQLAYQIDYEGYVNVTSSLQALTPGETYHLKAVCASTLITLFVDGVEILSDNIAPELENSTRFGMFLFNAGSAGGTFDNFAVYGS